MKMQFLTLLTCPFCTCPPQGAFELQPWVDLIPLGLRAGVISGKPLINFFHLVQLFFLLIYFQWRIAPLWDFPGGTSSKELACQCRRLKRQMFNPWIGKVPWRRAQQPTPLFLSGESPGQWSLVGYNPWGHKESDTTEVTEHVYVVGL